MTLARAFAGLMDDLLGPLGLVVYDAADPATKPPVASLFARELSSPGETSRLAGAAGAALEARGYKAQVTPGADAPRSSRSATRASRSGAPRAASFTIGDRQVSGADLVAEATAHPERFSPNVLLRPLVQDTLFPTIAYVGGPSELAYFAQLKDVYAHFGLPMPLIVPRATATFVDGAGLRFLQKSGVELGALQARDDGAAEPAARTDAAARRSRTRCRRRGPSRGADGDGHRRRAGRRPRRSRARRNRRSAR